MLAPLICLALFVAGVFGIVLGAARAASVDGGNKGQREVGFHPYISPPEFHPYIAPPEEVFYDWDNDSVNNPLHPCYVDYDEDDEG